MQSDPTLWFVLAGEDRSHFDVVSTLVDRVLTSHVEWFDATTREQLRCWRGEDVTIDWWSLKRAFSDARAAGLPVHGHFDEKPALPEAGMIRAQLLLWKHGHLGGDHIDVAIIARDTDHEARMVGAERLVEAGGWPFKVVLAYPLPEIEAWYVVGFEAISDAESARLDVLSKRLGFVPIASPERMTSTVSGSARDAKVVLEELTGNDRVRRDACLHVSLDLLRARGGTCGLSGFLAAVESTVVPLFTGTTRIAGAPRR